MFALQANGYFDFAKFGREHPVYCYVMAAACLLNGLRELQKKRQASSSAGFSIQ
jgi:hypothetical protein